MNKIWFGQFHVTPNKNNDLLSENAIGAYVNILALCNDRIEFINKTCSLLNALEFGVISYDQIQIFDPMNDDGNEFLKLSKSLTPENWIIMDTFHSYEKEI